MNRKIKSVTLHFPNSDDGSIVYYEVGRNGITEIKEQTYNPAEFCTVNFYDIYKGDECIASIYHYSIVEYF